MSFVRCLWPIMLLLGLSPLLAAQDITRHPAVEYIHETFRDVPWSIHVAKLDRQAKFRACTPLAQDHIYGLAPLTKLIAALPKTLGEPVVAVNGDFYHLEFEPYQGDPCGLQIVEGELVSTPANVSFWFDPQGNPRIGQISSQMAALLPDAKPLALGLNEARSDDRAVLFTPRCGETTRTRGGTELVLVPVDPKAWLPLRVQRTYLARIEAVKTGGDAAIPLGKMVLSLGPKLPVPALQPGAELKLATTLSEDLTGVQTAIGGGPRLIRDGAIVAHDPQGPRHPRTAVGFDDTGAWLLLVVVDGRQPGFSEGVTLYELAGIFKARGCTQAINLDGGGSSIMLVQVPGDGVRTVNSPSGKEPRPVPVMLGVRVRAAAGR